MAPSALEALRDVLVPPRCAGCGDAGSWYCVEWRDGSDPITRTIGVLALTAAGAHEGPLRDAIHRLKDGNEPGLASELVPVRLHPTRERECGYDQARALAAVVAATSGVPVRPALHRFRTGPAQATLGQRERQATVCGACAGVAGALRGLHVALIDDVATTGATLLDAAAAARACGARGVGAALVGFEE